MPPQCLFFRLHAENLSKIFRTSTNTIFSDIQLTTKFPSAIAINRNPNDNVIGVSCNNDASHDGGKRIIIVVKSAALVMVTMNGTRLVESGDIPFWSMGCR